MSKSPPFEIIFMLIFGFIILFAAFLVASYKNIPEDSIIPKSLETFEIVGTLDEDIVLSIISKISFFDNNNVIRYTKKSIDILREDFLNELASGVGPDLIVAPHEFILEQNKYNRITTIPFSSFSLNQYQEKYVTASDVFLTNEGSLAIPFLIDPLVMYVNKNFQLRHNIRDIPTKWSKLIDLKNVIEKDNFSIQKALISLGGNKNIPNRVDILSALWLQTLKDIVVFQNGRYVSVFNRSGNLPLASKTLEFYSRFSNPLSELYTWNESLRKPFFMFTQDRLFLYIDFVSQLQRIKNGNPNLSFDIVQIPQIDNNEVPVTFARVYGVAIPTSATDKNFSFTIAQYFGSSELAKNPLEFGGIPVAQNNLILADNKTSQEGTIYYAAFISRTWINNAPQKIEQILVNLLGNVLSSGARDVDSALSNAAKDIDTALQ